MGFGIEEERKRKRKYESTRERRLGDLGCGVHALGIFCIYRLGVGRKSTTIWTNDDDVRAIVI
ncbi:hypothetical protein L484_021474 [Morus notabilis]|uniref:Uncharacterized protein n=1 Tax=Morus notabilis TaxID=981085 RepID=W9SC66_9ROSA|nr:hypothetical protein L484_021474 [Morus notabilis]